ncbi:MAG: hypothetical protein IT423_06470, partial [Pirellulaceae bacterium]|nr:hypothetical protein [Pirellulaceae bacterium]
MLPHILVIHRTLHPTFQRILCRILCRTRDRFTSPFTWQHSVASLCVVGLLASGPWSVAQSIDFRTDVLPILSEHCLSCHGADQQESQLRLDSMLDALRGGDSGEQVIVPGQSHKRHLTERIVSPDPA